LVEQVQVPVKEPALQVLPHPGQKGRGPVKVLQGQAVEPRRGHRPDPLRADQMVPASQGADDLLPDLTALAVGADDLQVFVSDAFADITFNPDEHVVIMAL
jgi:hypothetical protein